MNEDVIIRKANKGDFKEIHELVMLVHKIHVENRSDIYKDIDPLDINTFEEEILNENNIYLVAEYNKEIIGICFAEFKNVLNNKIMKDQKIIHISDICVKKENQKKGIGKKLYNEILNIYGIDSKVVGDKHKSVEFDVDKYKIRADATIYLPYKSIGMKIKSIRFEKKIT